MRKVVSKEVTAGGRFDFFLDSENLIPTEGCQSQLIYSGMRCAISFHAFDLFYCPWFGH